MDVHAFLGILIFLELIIGVTGLLILYRGQREIARMTRAVAGLVVQEEEKTRELVRQRG